MTAELIERLRERVRDYIYDCTKDEFNIGWTLSAEQADHLVELVGQSLSDRIAVLEGLVHESLFHLRLDARAEAYHERALAALPASLTPQEPK